MEVKTKAQIAAEYDISVKTLSKKLKAVEIEIPRGLIYPKEQKIIYERLGPPKFS